MSMLRPNNFGFVFVAKWRKSNWSIRMPRKFAGLFGESDAYGFGKCLMSEFIALQSPK